MKSWLKLQLIFLMTSLWNVLAINFEELPAVAMDYKITISAGKEDCYFQFVSPGATFYVSFQVIRGGDGMAGFAVRNPVGDLVHPYQWQNQADYQDISNTGGYYSICVDNQFAKIGEKLINLYITVIKYDQWEKYNNELEQLHLSVENFTTALSVVEHNINNIRQYQHHSRSRESIDYNLLVDNNSYVYKFSMVLIIVAIISSFVQVYFVRRLFEVKRTHSWT